MTAAASDELACARSSRIGPPRRRPADPRRKRQPAAYRRDGERTRGRRARQQPATVICSAPDRGDRDYYAVIRPALGTWRDVPPSSRSARAPAGAPPATPRWRGTVIQAVRDPIRSGGRGLRAEPRRIAAPKRDDDGENPGQHACLSGGIPGLSRRPTSARRRTCPPEVPRSGTGAWPGHRAALPCRIRTDGAAVCQD